LKGLRVVDGEYRLDGFENVFVADASIFPSTITVNPQWTIMAMSSLAAKSVLRNTL
jgi:choline dehydrogenase-like flavoprotein